ncbi:MULTISPECIES: N-acetylmuramoyl-L-alanine amidase [unclassified Fusibacter]|uniref:N-acetylmuramoyl-L-alanine amidase n=1 Tax=unclassified Fusibacter TaxID=2624464 RepID=UPI0010102E78|nr:MULTISPECIES: N-acetylmuramoyl-L-alanine amidase [unclassified Fusibacter]MCK8060789.1 N-acetylmuramoyl-L-alanine amidase family protein [Fusibacter sp. A2]NPE23085.1 AMIN domain-containing protein [Fusibacter sp. A1]RXV59755.1 AMIN domain-containing protein [Fusibacter sp. A1]
MRRIITMMLVLCLVMGTVPISFASKFLEYDEVLLTDTLSSTEKAYKTVSVMLGGEDIITDVPAILYNLNGKDRTLVPVRVISESLGADVAWNGDKKQVTITYNSKKIVLTIDSAKALVNGKSYTLPDGVPAKLMAYQGTNRTLVPARFVSEQLGLDVGWIGDTRTVLLNKNKQSVTGISYDGTGKFQEVLIHTTGPVDVSSFYLDGGTVGVNNKLVLDIPNAAFNFSDKTKVDSKGVSYLGIHERYLTSVRASQFQVTPIPTTRVVIDMDEKKGYEIIKENNKIRIQFINTVKDIRTQEVFNAQSVIIKTGEAPAYNVDTWNGKVIIDVVNSKMKYASDAGSIVPVNKGGIESYSYSQLDATEFYGANAVVSRVVVTLDDPTKIDNVYVEDVDNEIYVYVAGNPLNNFTYGKDSIATSKLTLTGINEVDYQTVYLEDEHTLMLFIPQTFTYLNDFDMKPNDHIMHSIDVKLVNGVYTVTMVLNEATDFVKSETSGKSIAFNFVNEGLKELNNTNKLIVIDAGHGGKDPGAVSPIDKTKEKDLVLKATLLLGKQLEGLGFKVYYTRDYDTYVGLYDRASIANELGADAFVSIHVNAAQNSSASGVEMLYVDDSRNSKVMATLLQSELVKATGAKSRGVIERSKLVVIRETLMPAVLAEIGFLTNANELRSLNDDTYLDSIVEGLMKGLVRYLED